MTEAAKILRDDIPTDTLQEMLDALEREPDKRLSADGFWDNEIKCFCASGVWLKGRGLYYDGDEFELATSEDIGYVESLATINDDFGPPDQIETASERYVRVVETLREALA